MYSGGKNTLGRMKCYVFPLMAPVDPSQTVYYTTRTALWGAVFYGWRKGYTYTTVKVKYTVDTQIPV